MKTWKISPHASDPLRIVLIGPYDKDFAEELRLSVPYRDRRFDGASKSWIILAAHTDTVQSLIDQHTSTEGPSDFIGCDVRVSSGHSVGTVAGVDVRGGALIVTVGEGPQTTDDLRRRVVQLGEDAGNAQVWEALEAFIGDPESVTVRRVGDRLVILAEVQT